MESVRASVQKVIQRRQGKAGRAVVDGRSMERCDEVGSRSSYDMLISVDLLIAYSPQVVRPPTESAQPIASQLHCGTP